MSVNRLPAPVFDGEKRYDRYIQEVNAWCAVQSGVADKDKAVILALSLPDHDPSGVKDKLFNDVSLEELNCEGGVEKFKQFMDSLFKKDDLTSTYECYVQFEKFRRGSNQTVDEFLIEFDKLYNRADKRGVKLPDVVKAFKLLDACDVDSSSKMMILTAVDYVQKDQLYEQMKSALRKFQGGQIFGGHSSAQSIKLEPAFLAENEEVLLAAGYVKRGGRSRGRGFGSSRQSNSGFGRGSNSGFGRGNGSKNGGPTASKIDAKDGQKKKINPVGADGKRLVCVSCGSFRHMLADCPDSWENLAISFEEANVCDVVDVVLFTGNDDVGLSQLSSECATNMILDSACTSTVTGSEWLEAYIGSLPQHLKSSVKEFPGGKYFKFGGGEVLKSTKEVEIPCQIAGRVVSIRTSVVESELPLLLSLTWMKESGVVMDYVHDKATIFGETVDLDVTSAGHYSIPLSHGKASDCCYIALDVNSDETEKRKALLKLHRQFGHKGTLPIETLLKESGTWDVSYRQILDDIQASCKTCALYRNTPPRPVVCLRPASQFGEVLTVDLKEWKDDYIMHMIDAFTRFTQSCVLKRKLPKVVVDNLLRHWFGIFGAPGSIFSDCGGEFSNEEVEEMGHCLGVEIRTTAAYAPWMNGLNERNHCVTDRILEKMLADQPNLSLDVALCWANMAKNSLQMHHGFSSYQLVLGANPRLPNVVYDKLPSLEGVTTSETVVAHLQGLHTARKEFIASESSERIRRALRHKVRACERSYANGEKVYYKRDADKWKGPAVVIGHDGNTYFLRHGANVVRVAANRIVGVEDGDSGVSDDRFLENNTTNLSNDNAVEDGAVTVEAGFDTVSGHPGIGVGVENGESVSELVLQETVNGEVSDESKVESSTVPKISDVIEFRGKGQTDWQEVTVIGRAGKVSGRNKDWFNVSADGRSFSLDFGNVDWRSKESETANLTRVTKSLNAGDIWFEAKKRELQSFKKLNVYEEVEDIGQDRVSSRWILSKKTVAGKEEMKARLVCRGFEELNSARTDSPVCGKEVTCLFHSVAASFGWLPEFTDVKSAFLQGEPLERDVFVEPPSDVRKPGVIWRLNVCLYGLNDAPRRWFLKVVSVLCDLGLAQSKIHPALFLYKIHSGLSGILIVHVDDFLHAGDRNFSESVVQPLRNKFTVGITGQSSFRYTGLNVTTFSDAIQIDQFHYTSSLETVSLPASRKSEKLCLLTPCENKLYRAAVGSLNWLSQQTRPDISYDVLEFSMKLREATVEDVLKVNKCLK